jgi:hypothetical protein
MGNLTDAKLRAMKPTGRVQKISDGDGLYAYIEPKSRGISWQMAYSIGSEGSKKFLSWANILKFPLVKPVGGVSTHANFLSGTLTPANKKGRRVAADTGESWACERFAASCG